MNEKTIKINLENYGFSAALFLKEPWGNEPLSSPAGIPARVTAVHRERYALVCQYGETWGRLKGKEYYGGLEEYPTVGDFVLADYIDAGDSRIVRTLPRRTFFSRRDPDPGRQMQAVAANFDYVFIMQSLNQNFSTARLERYLTLGWQSGAEPVVVLTKADLLSDYGEYLRAAQTAAAGVQVHVVSALTGAGMEALSEYMKPGRTAVFLGSSGVGKSSLVNALAGEEVMSVGEIRQEDGRGRHTTTHRQLVMLKSGAMIIDTPGMRELGMWDVSEGLGEAFSDVEALLGRCRFRNCRHRTEPGCAIKEAIENGALSPGRWERYQKLKGEAKYSDDKTAYLLKRQKIHKQMARMSRQKRTAERRNRVDGQ